MNDIPRSEFPRPDFERDNWLCLNGRWEFSIGEASYDRTIVVPFACETALSGVEDRGFHSRVFYRRQVELPSRMRGLHILLHFGAVDYACRVLVNGRLAGAHEGGQTPFCMDVTDLIGNDARFTLEAEVEDDPSDLEMPRGKQFWEQEQRSIFYDRTTGIWQSVWLEAVEPLHLADCKLTPLFDERAVKLEYSLAGYQPCDIEMRMTFQGREAGRIRVEALSADGSLVAAIDQSALGQWNFCEDLCWTPETPRLFDVELSVACDGHIIDRVHTYFGMRKVSIENGVFMLNNRPYYQKLVLDQGYWRQSLLTAPCDSAYETDIRLVKSMGFNGVRKHQKVEDPRFLYHADRLGLLVWGEIGAAYLYSRKAATRLYREWTEAVLRDYNHPCIVAWTPLNESWGVQEIGSSAMQQAHSRALYYLTRSLDGTRPVIDNDGWEHTRGDLLTIHDYTPDGKELGRHFCDRESILKLHPGGRSLFVGGYEDNGSPVLVSEFGGIKFTPDADKPEAWGYCEAVCAEQYEASLGGLISALRSSPQVQGYCYTQLTDVGTEENGLLTIDRKPKLDVGCVRRIQEGG